MGLQEMSTAEAESEYKTGICQWCHNKGAVYVDNNRCEGCDRIVRRCSVCKEDQHSEDHCRHVFEDSNFDWSGSGIGKPEDNIKAAFLRLLGLMPEGFAPDLHKAIRSGRFYTWMIAPLIGGGGLLELHGMPNRDGQSMLFKWGDALMDIGGSDAAEDTADGYRWLVSLYKRKTRDANHVTMAWIDEWKSSVERDKANQ